RGGRLADAVPPCRLDRVVLPRRDRDARRRRLARRAPVRREPARAPALLREAPRAAPGGAGAAAAPARPAAARARAPPAGVPRGDPLPLVRQRAHPHLVIENVRL